MNQPKLSILCFILFFCSAKIYAQDDCSTATTISPSVACSYTTFDLPGSLTKSTGAPTTCGGANIVDDAWAKFTATGTASTVKYQNTSRDAALWIYRGTCASLTYMTCVDNIVNIGVEEVTFATVVGTTYYIRIGRMSGNSSASMSGSICVVCGTPPINDEPCDAILLNSNSSCSYSYYSNVMATSSAGVTAPGCGGYVGGDVWFKTVVPASGALTINTDTGSLTDAAMAIYTGTCGSLTLFNCYDDGGGSNGLMPSVNLTCLNPGDTLRIRYWDANNDNVGTFRICLINPGGTSGIPSNDNPCNAILITPSAACSYTTYSNQCASASTGITAPGCANYLGGDVWFKIVTPASGNFSIDTKEGTITDGGMALYTGSCSSLTLVSCDDDNSMNGTMPYLSVSGAASGTVYYLRFWEYGNDNNGTFGICVTDPCPNGPPLNDACVNATPLLLGVPTTGNNSCSSSTNEPSGPTCWTNGAGQLNTVWYTVVAPASGKISVRTGLGTLINTQIQAFSGTCSNLVSIGCSDDITLCGNTQLWSQLLLTGLTPGAIYFIRVDGYNGLTGDFTITAIDGNTNWPAVPGQDCSTALSVCSASMSVGDPGFLGSGNYCDYPGNLNGCSTGSCIVVGERNAVWYSFATNASGTLQFTLSPNSPVDYDWALYDVTGLANGCSNISAGTLAPIRCSYWGGTGPTGMALTGTETCDGTTGTLDGWANVLTTTANKQYLLFVSNYSLSTFVGYNLSFGSSPINFNQSNTLTWTGAAGSNWNNSNNWGGCSLPDCSRDVLIYAGPSSQPIIPDNTTISCRNLTIQAGATLTFGQNCTLNICGSYVNNGILNMPASSTIQFQNSAIQTVDGNMTGSNKFGNFTVVKTGGSLRFIQDADIGGNLTINSTASSTSFNARKIKLAGNFSNPSSTLVLPLNSTLEFTAGNNQTYNQGPLSLKQQNVTVDKTGGVVTLQSDLTLDEQANLNLVNGVIYTATYKTIITNDSSSSVIGGNANSFIDGELVRSMDIPITPYKFPVGKIGKGFELATVTYTSATNISSLSAKFNAWTTVPMGPATNDCGGANYGLLQLFNNGYWTFNSVPAIATGTYNMTLAPNGQTNAGINAGTTIVKSTNGGTSWALDGNCVIGSNSSLAARTMMSGFGTMAIGQTSSPLPIELLSFTGTLHEKYNLLEWITATEKNNDFFTLQRSFDGITFEAIGNVKGAGNSNLPLNYSFKDNYPKNGITYYQLLQTDYDGTISKSGVIALNRKGNKCLVSAFPNPSSGNCVLDIETPTIGDYTVFINDILGKELYREKVLIDKEEFKHAFNITDFKSGVYNCTIENDITKERVNVRLIKQ